MRMASSPDSDRIMLAMSSTEGNGRMVEGFPYVASQRCNRTRWDTCVLMSQMRISGWRQNLPVDCTFLSVPISTGRGVPWTGSFATSRFPSKNFVYICCTCTLRIMPHFSHFFHPLLIILADDLWRKPLPWALGGGDPLVIISSTLTAASLFLLSCHTGTLIVACLCLLPCWSLTVVLLFFFIILEMDCRRIRHSVPHVDLHFEYSLNHLPPCCNSPPLLHCLGCWIQSPIFFLPPHPPQPRESQFGRLDFHRGEQPVKVRRMPKTVDGDSEIQTRGKCHCSAVCLVLRNLSHDTPIHSLILLRIHDVVTLAQTIFGWKLFLVSPCLVASCKAWGICILKTRRWSIQDSSMQKTVVLNKIV